MVAEIVIATAVFIVILTMVLCVRSCVKYCPCGPESLAEGDIEAFSTFKQLYQQQQIEVAESSFDAAERAYCCCCDTKYALCCTREIYLAVSPANTWTCLYKLRGNGFMADVAGEINEHLQRFQYLAWQQHGDFICNYPTVVVAQEWRQWSMETLQYVDNPDMASKEMVAQRLSWVNAVRGMELSGIADLRKSRFWDESDDLSLLLVFRLHVGPRLQHVYDCWESISLQQVYGERLRQIFLLMKQLVKHMLRLLETIMSQSELRVSTWSPRGTNNLQGLPSLALQIHKMSHLLKEQLFEQASTRTSEFDLEHLIANPLARAGENLAYQLHIVEHRADDAAKQTLLETPAEIGLRDEILQNAQASSFGLQDAAFTRLLERVIFYFRTIDAVKEMALLLRFQARFAQLGGQLFLTRELRREHCAETLEAALRAVHAADNQAKSITYAAQAGWENLRRKGWKSLWSDSGPLDNFRLGLHAQGDLSNAAHELKAVLHDLLTRATGAVGPGEVDLKKEIDAELACYKALWKLLQPRHKFAESTQGVDEDVALDLG
eukprot:TRINITY_DN60449_c0_g1_i1.p1 TRINITY_DN60449_c0_g1~~TRINITY_DN60449_c0_g1_i1.p1  ORF type:complete len:550 (-),score=114.74 TRINITY_DN60449_c0_g1_i1:60-1709(-)